MTIRYTVRERFRKLKEYVSIRYMLFFYCCIFLLNIFFLNDLFFTVYCFAFFEWMAEVKAVFSLLKVLLQVKYFSFYRMVDKFFIWFIVFLKYPIEVLKQFFWNEIERQHIEIVFWLEITLFVISGFLGIRRILNIVQEFFIFYHKIWIWFYKKRVKYTLWCSRCVPHKARCDAIQITDVTDWLKCHSKISVFCSIYYFIKKITFCNCIENKRLNKYWKKLAWDLL